MSLAVSAGPVSRADALTGCLLGTAVGDALGLPYEGLSPRRAERLYGPPGRYRFLFGRGMVSDDTEHACLVAQALIASGRDEERFARELASRLRWWLLGLPAGAGRATLRACARLWLGYGPDRSGVFSAGNGAAMRAAILGAAVEDRDRLRALVRVSSRVTHSDPRSEAGALVVALAARRARLGPVPSGEAFLAEAGDVLGDTSPELMDRLAAAVGSAAREEVPCEFAARLGLVRGVSGYVNDTVPVAVQAWLRFPQDYRAAVVEVIRCGGDADTTAALVGGLVGTAAGPQGVPGEWLAGLAEWPRSVEWMRLLAGRLELSLVSDGPAEPLSLPAVPLLVRNVAFLAAVLAHGFYRLRPW